MGVDFVLFERLCDLSQRFQPQGRTLMLGRHNFRVQPKLERLYDRTWSQTGREGTWRDTLQDDGYCETLMSRLGFGAMEAMDFSDYEGAALLQDLSDPVPEALEGQFDLIFDGGTLEHVFNVPVALASVFRMLKPGGRFVSANGMNGWMGHGLYQFNPDLVWSFWQRMCGCKVHFCAGIEKTPQKSTRIIDFPDPATSGRRLRLRTSKSDFPAGRVYLYYEVEKLPESVMGRKTLQSDYETKWAPHKTAATQQEPMAKEAQDGRD